MDVAISERDLRVDVTISERDPRAVQTRVWTHKLARVAGSPGRARRARRPQKKGPGVITTSGTPRLCVPDAKTAIEITNVYNPKFRQLLYALPSGINYLTFFHMQILVYIS